MLICNSKFSDKAKIIKDRFPKISIAINDEVHSKLCLVSPKTVFVGSSNFGLSGWHEVEIGIKSEKAYNYYVENTFIPLWKDSTEIT